jgi:hypothetical protein
MKKLILIFTVLTMGLVCKGQTTQPSNTGVNYDQNTNHLVIFQHGAFTWLPGLLGGTQTITTRGSTTLNNYTAFVYVQPTSKLDSVMLTLPATPMDQDLVTLEFSGVDTVATVLTVSANTAQSLQDSIHISNPIKDSTFMQYLYSKVNSKWYRTY